VDAGNNPVRSSFVDSAGHFSHEAETADNSDGADQPRTADVAGVIGRGVSRARSVNRRMGPESRERALVVAINRLEQEHVALLMALCELEDSSTDSHDASQDALVRSALQALLREDLRRTQHALRRAGQGTYGICEVCQQPLSRRHLTLAPGMSRCWACTGRAPREH
jgi:RNA polymerase-binding transcription factor DksA